MSAEERINIVIEQLFTQAKAEFETSQVGKLFKEKLDWMYWDCEGMFMDDDRAFTMECFALLKQSFSVEEQFVCKRGISDGIMLLKGLRFLD